MPHTEHFYVSSKDNSVKSTNYSSEDFFLPDGKKNGEAKYIIEVFGYNHFETAKKVRDMVDNAKMENNLFTIKVETR
jgi:hypothetical protein